MSQFSEAPKGEVMNVHRRKNPAEFLSFPFLLFAGREVGLAATLMARVQIFKPIFQSLRCISQSKESCNGLAEKTELITTEVTVCRESGFRSTRK